MSMEKTDVSLHEMYKSILEGYLHTGSEHALYEAQQFSRQLIKEKMSPEEMINLHISVVQQLVPHLPKEVLDCNEFLIEVMVGYGLAYREHQSLRNRQKQLQSELAVAAKMQQELLPKNIPLNKELEIGIKSVAADVVSGDYYHFMEDGGHINVAVADIIGKGIPASLSMSMIKYAIDSLPEQRLQPGALLENLNRVVEQNISSNMFITMIYGSYDLKTHKFHYAGAGHEPGFFYKNNLDEFQDLKTKGLVLGVSKKATFIEYEQRLEKGDFVVLLTDGVTECRTKNGFIDRSEIPKLLRKYKSLPVQEIVENIYAELEGIQNFQLQDDFTLMILRRKV